MADTTVVGIDLSHVPDSGEDDPMPDEDMGSLPSPTRARAQKAAATRWRSKAGA
jgi:hypothetical protein